VKPVEYVIAVDNYFFDFLILTPEMYFATRN